MSFEFSLGDSSLVNRGSLVESHEGRGFEANEESAGYLTGSAEDFSDLFPDLPEEVSNERVMRSLDQIAGRVLGADSRDSTESSLSSSGSSVVLPLMSGHQSEGDRTGSSSIEEGQPAKRPRTGLWNVEIVKGWSNEELLTWFYFFKGFLQSRSMSEVTPKGFTRRLNKLLLDQMFEGGLLGDVLPGKTRDQIQSVHGKIFKTSSERDPSPNTIDGKVHCLLTEESELSRQLKGQVEKKIKNLSF